MNEALVAIDRLTAATDALAASLVAEARLCTTPGIERAILRLFDVGGLSDGGRPLAHAVVERHAGGDPDALARGIGLPFAMAVAEYDVSPRRLALDVASGVVVLRDEALLLEEPDRRAAAEAEVARLVRGALESGDANRLARRELTTVVGDAPWPWVGVPLHESAVDDALEEAAAAVRAGADVLKVTVPSGRELADHVAASGAEPQRWTAPAGRAGDTDVAPAGSQRGLGALRRRADELSAERRGTVRLMTTASPMAFPESAVVAALERIDIVASDPVIDAVDGGIDPERAVTDAVFGYRLLERAGCTLVLGPGPLVVGPDLAAGAPADAPTRAGRALGLAVLSVALARSVGMPDDRICLGGLPAWVSDEATGALALVGVALRRACLPDVPMSFEEPPSLHPRWLALMAAGLVDAAPTALVVRDVGIAAVTPALAATRSAIGVAEAAAAAFEPRSLRPDGMELALAMLHAAADIVERITDDGWPAVVPGIASGRAPIGAGTTVRREPGSDPFDLA
ncbi:MAG TPA: lysine 5,6-aminomutase subunit alpha [Candidatus Limnocylindrales bacterium]|nr:lysine 5,6-aminomutase subunit alpha [Candidatus Limnocylindrales bacterium]